MTTKDLDLRQFLIDYESQRVKNGYTLSVGYLKALTLANFINQDLNIGMFVAAVFKNSEWVVLEKPKMYDHWKSVYDSNKEGLTKGRYTNHLSVLPSCYEYLQAKENVFFAGFEVTRNKDEFLVIKGKINLIYDKRVKSFVVYNGWKVEKLIPYEIPLTENAITRYIQGII